MTAFPGQRLFRKAMALLGFPSARMRAALGGNQGRILMYHRVADEAGDRLSVRPARFEEQIRFLRGPGVQVVPLSELIRPRSPPDRRLRVALTFDDGFGDFYDTVFPLLTRCFLPATVFVVPALIEGGATLKRYRGRPPPPLSWEMLKEMMGRGIEIASHSLTHRELPGISPAEAREEIVRSALLIEEKTGVRPEWFAYPRGKHTPAVRGMVQAAGYRGAVTVAPGSVRAGSDPFTLPRTEISGNDDRWDFRMKLAGAFDPWHRVWQKMNGVME